MENCVRNCKRIAAVESSITGISKKMKIDFNFDEFNLPPLNFQPLAAASSPDNSFSPATSSNSGADLCSRCLSGDNAPASCCSCNESSEVVVDLKAKSFETASSTCIDNNRATEFYGDTDEMDWPTAKTSSRRKLPAAGAAKMPTQAEIDEFFAVAEKGEEQKRFTEKYNYDIVKDAPSEGRYQWTRLKP